MDNAVNTLRSTRLLDKTLTPNFHFKERLITETCQQNVQKARHECNYVKAMKSQRTPHRKMRNVAVCVCVCRFKLEHGNFFFEPYEVMHVVLNHVSCAAKT